MTTPDYAEFAAVAAAANARGIMVSAAGIKEIDRLLADHFAGAGKTVATSIAPDPEALEGREADEFVIRKGGYYYRPNAQGYTSSVHEAGRYSLADAISLTHPNGPDGPRDELSYMPAAAREVSGERAEIERQCAELIANYYRAEIGRLMQQAEHWAENGAPLATHHRVNKADSYFQIVCLMERDTAKGWKPPFEEIRDQLAKPPMKQAGAYPPSPALHRYRDACYVAALVTSRADLCAKVGTDLAEARADVALWKREAADRSQGMVQLNLDRAAMGVAILQLRECVESLIAIRPSNWTDDPEDAAVWSAAEAVLRATAQP